MCDNTDVLKCPSFKPEIGTSVLQPVIICHFIEINCSNQLSKSDGGYLGDQNRGLE